MKKLPISFKMNLKTQNIFKNVKKSKRPDFGVIYIRA